MRSFFLILGVLFAFGLSNATFAAPVRQSLNAKALQISQLAPLQALLQAPDSQIDLAKAKLTIDSMIDPRIDAGATLQQIDTLAARIKARFPPGANSQAKLELLVLSLSQPGPWNDHRPFNYDLNDPFGKNIRNKLLSSYLASRKGNCVSMPVLLVILGQKVGLSLTLATAPEHVFAKFRNDRGQWINIEATSFGTKSDASYQQEMGISSKAMTTSIYLRPLSNKEAVVVMMGTLMEFYSQQGQQDRRIDVANLALQADPKNIEPMLHKGGAYFRMLKERYLSKYQSRGEMSPIQQRDFDNLGRQNKLWFSRAAALGWTEPTQAQNASYLQHVQRTKAAKHGGQ